MSTDKDGTQAEEWQVGIGNVLHALLEGAPRERLLAAQWLNNRYATIIADHRKAAKADALAAALREAVSDLGQASLALAGLVPVEWDAPSVNVAQARNRADAALASYASNPAEAGE